MNKFLFIAILFLANFLNLKAQTNPVITSWIQNTTTFGSYYVSGNPTPIPMSVLANCQQVRYSTNWVYVNTHGIPSYPTGIFTGDGNINLAGDQNAIYKFPLNPTENTGTPTATNSGNIGVFINGVSLFDWRDGVAYSATAVNGVCGGPPGTNPPCSGGPGSTQAWNRDAIPAEKLGFDCSKGHPAGTNYHHHQNPTAFKFDSPTSISFSNICDLYDSDGLYIIDPTEHSPLIGFAYDGFPIYGAYGYTNIDGTGGISRMKSSYQLRVYPNGIRTNGPAVGQVIGNQTFFNGYFKEDYEYVSHPNDPTYLDEHNGRFCKTPEYPNGIYCYFATVDTNNTSVYPYVVGPTFYGNVTAAKVTSVTESTTVYPSTLSTTGNSINDLNIKIFPNPTTDLIAIQVGNINYEDLDIKLYDMQGKLINETKLFRGQTISYLDIQTLYSGTYLIKISTNNVSLTQKIIVEK